MKTMQKALPLCAIIMLLVSTASSSIAECRNAFEFYSAYTLRLQTLDEIEQTSYSPGLADSIFMGGFIVPGSESNEYAVMTPAGTLIISVPSFELTGFNTVITGSQSNAEDRMQAVARAAMAYGALEYDGLEDKYQDFILAIKGESNTRFVSVIYDEFFNMVNNTLNDNTKVSALVNKKGNSVMIHSGKYNYYLSYYRTGSNGEDYVIEFVAKKKD